MERQLPAISKVLPVINKDFPISDDIPALNEISDRTETKLDPFQKQ